MRDSERTLVSWSVAGALVASFAVLWPFLPAILLALWLAALLRPSHARLAARLGGRPRVAALAATLALVAVAVPLVVVAASLAEDAIALVQRALASDRVRGALGMLSTAEGGAGKSRDLIALAVDQGGRAWSLAGRVAGTTLRTAGNLAIVIAGCYEFLVEGPRWFAWLADRAPVSPATARRLGGAVLETGRGLLYGILGAGFVQAVVATVFYVALDVPQPYALGLLTLACSIVPTIGTAIVWVPVAVGLVAVGRDTAAAILATGGALAIGSVDNLVRPYLARKGSLQLPTVVVALGMFGGVAVLGPRGLLLGPLVLRLAVELLEIVREQREA